MAERSWVGRLPHQLSDAWQKQATSAHLPDMLSPFVSGSDRNMSSLVSRHPNMASLLFASSLSELDAWQVPLNEAARIYSVELLDSPPVLLCASTVGKIFVFDRITLKVYMCNICVCLSIRERTPAILTACVWCVYLHVCICSIRGRVYMCV
jgi:hypothetical protein